MEVRPLFKSLGTLTSSGLARTGARAGSGAITTMPTAAATARRQQSTTSRTKKALKIPPHPSFLSSPRTANHIVFNPPSAAPSVYHTPFKFLPKSDPRRQANLSSFLHRTDPLADDGSKQPQQQLPPMLTAHELQRVTPNRHVTMEQVEEIRALRAQDPERWSVLRLAEKYKCTNYFIMMCVSAPLEHQLRERERRDAIRARWGPMRTHARLERRKRREMLLRGEL